jgi:hypothetical protein
MSRSKRCVVAGSDISCESRSFSCFDDGDSLARMRRQMFRFQTPRSDDTSVPFGGEARSVTKDNVPGGQDVVVGGDVVV